MVLASNPAPEDRRRVPVTRRRRQLLHHKETHPAEGASLAGRGTGKGVKVQPGGKPSASHPRVGENSRATAPVTGPVAAASETTLGAPLPPWPPEALLRAPGDLPPSPLCPGRGARHCGRDTRPVRGLGWEPEGAGVQETKCQLCPGSRGPLFPTGPDALGAEAPLMGSSKCPL